MAEKPLELDADVQQDNAQEANEPEDRKPRQGDQYRPYCRVHMCLMVSRSSSKGVTRYNCPVPGCKQGEKRAWPTSMIPREPQECPLCRQRLSGENGRKKADPVYCVVDYQRSSFAMLELVCPTPGCHFHVRVPRPDVAARARRMRPRDDAV